MTTGIEAPKERPYRGVAQEARAAERRRRLIEAGIQVFGAHTYHGGTVRAVCVAAGLTERYFYESFLNREQLLRAAYEVLCDGLHQRFDAILAAPEGRLQGVLDAFFSFVETDRPGARILLFEVLGVSAAIDERYRAAMRGFAGVLLRALPGAGPHAALDPALIADGLIGAFVHMAQRWVLGGYRQPRAEMVACAEAIALAVARDLTSPCVAAATASGRARTDPAGRPGAPAPDGSR